MIIWDNFLLVSIKTDVYLLKLSTQGKIFSRLYFELFFLFLLENMF